MTKTLYYYDAPTGEQIELFAITNMPNAEFEAAFPREKGRRADSFSRWVGRASDGRILPVWRTIHYASRPSMHKCDSRCMNAKGHSCECACGGKNHGRGYYSSGLPVAAPQLTLF